MFEVVVGKPFKDFGEGSQIIGMVFRYFVDEFCEYLATDNIIIKRENLICFHSMGFLVKGGFIKNVFVGNKVF